MVLLIFKASLRHNQPLIPFIVNNILILSGKYLIEVWPNALDLIFEGLFYVENEIWFLEIRFLISLSHLLLLVEVKEILNGVDVTEVMV
jgi:hypothetical protein